MRHFEVVAKCGHVGRDYYYEGHFFLQSETASNAAQYVKTFPRVKKDHDDVILWVSEVEKDEYIAGVIAMKINPYFSCESKYQQKAVWDLIKEGIRSETEHQQKYRKSNRYYEERKTERKTNGKGIRNPYKYAKYNNVYNDYDPIGA